MRKVINISVPEQMYKAVGRAAKKGGFASKSEYIRFIIRKQEEDQAMREIAESKKEARNGNLKELNSLRDLR